MDRTLLDGRVIQALGKALGFEEEAMRIIAERDSGAKSQDAVTVAVARLLKGARTADFDKAVAGIPLTPGAREAVERLQQAKVAVAICSDSYSRAVAPLADRLGVRLFAANVLQERVGAFTGALLPWGPALGLGNSAPTLDKTEAIPLLASKAGVPLRRTAHVGDGDHDARVFPMVGLGIAFQGTPLARKSAQHAVEGSLEPVAGFVLEWLAM